MHGLLAAAYAALQTLPVHFATGACTANPAPPGGRRSGGSPPRRAVVEARGVEPIASRAAPATPRTCRRAVWPEGVGKPRRRVQHDGERHTIGPDRGVMLRTSARLSRRPRSRLSSQHAMMTSRGRPSVDGNGQPGATDVGSRCMRWHRHRRACRRRRRASASGRSPGALDAIRHELPLARTRISPPAPRAGRSSNARLQQVFVARVLRRAGTHDRDVPKAPRERLLGARSVLRTDLEPVGRAGRDDREIGDATVFSRCPGRIHHAAPIFARRVERRAAEVLKINVAAPAPPRQRIRRPPPRE